MTASLIQIPARNRLASFVRSIRLVTDGVLPTTYVRLPDGEVEFVLQTFPVSCGPVLAIGTRMSAFRKTVDVAPQTLAVRFKAGGAYPFFGRPMSELTDRIVSVDDLWGDEGPRFRERFAVAGSTHEKLRAVEEALTERLNRSDVYEPSCAPLVRRAVRILSMSEQLPRVSRLSRTLGISSRQLRRAFDDVVGVGPKFFTRVIRFQRALSASRQTARPDWGVVARQVGYYDQAHLIGEFRELTGITPTELLRQSPNGPRS